MENDSLMKVECIAECSKGSILQYIRPALLFKVAMGIENHFLAFFLSGSLKQVLLYL